MGIRGCVSRFNRRRQKERARARRRALMMLARPRCLVCGVALVRDASEAELWHCTVCGASFLREASVLVPRGDEVFFRDEEILRKAA